MEIYIKQLEKHLNGMEEYSKLADEAEQKMIENPLDMKAEHEFDVYYTKEFDSMQNAISIMKVLIKCDDKTARKMIVEKKAEIKDLISRMI